MVGLPLGSAELHDGNEGQVRSVGQGQLGEARVTGEPAPRVLCSGVKEGDCLWALDGEKGSGWLLWGRRTLIIPLLLFPGSSEHVGRWHGRQSVVSSAVSLSALPVKLCLNPV